ncbi:MAG: M28 family peptidase, partial [Planctomycetia bacterium]
MQRLLLFLSGVVLYAALLALNHWSLEPRAAAAAQAALQRWRALPGANVPHPLGSAAHAELRGALERHFQGLPLERAHQTMAAGLTNFALRRAGTSSLPPVVLMAHWDSVAAGPGAADDGAGMSVLLELAERCTKNMAAPLRSTIFLATDGEERGLLGAKAFFEEHPWARDGGVLINLEARGTSGPVFLFETIGNQRALIETAQGVMPFPAAFSLAAEIYERMPNDTDLSVFRADPRWHGYNLAFIRGLEHYHTAQDNADNLSSASVAHMLESAEALLEVWQREAHTPQGREPAPHTSLWGRVLLWWPARANLPIALALLVFAGLWLQAAWRAWLGGWLVLVCAGSLA